MERANLPWSMREFEAILNAEVPALKVMEIPSKLSPDSLGPGPIPFSPDARFKYGKFIYRDFRMGALGKNLGYVAHTVRVGDLMNWSGIVRGRSVGRYRGLLRGLMEKMFASPANKEKLLSVLNAAKEFVFNVKSAAAGAGGDVGESDGGDDVGGGGGGGKAGGPSGGKPPGGGSGKPSGGGKGPGSGPGKSGSGRPGDALAIPDSD